MFFLWAPFWLWLFVKVKFVLISVVLIFVLLLILLVFVLVLIVLILVLVLIVLWHDFSPFWINVVYSDFCGKLSMFKIHWISNALLFCRLKIVLQKVKIIFRNFWKNKNLFYVLFLGRIVHYNSSKDKFKERKKNAANDILKAGRRQDLWNT